MDQASFDILLQVHQLHSTGQTFDTEQMAVTPVCGHTSWYNAQGQRGAARAMTSEVAVTGRNQARLNGLAALLQLYVAAGFSAVF